MTPIVTDRGKRTQIAQIFCRGARRAPVLLSTDAHRWAPMKTTDNTDWAQKAQIFLALCALCAFAFPSLRLRVSLSECGITMPLFKAVTWPSTSAPDGASAQAESPHTKRNFSLCSLRSSVPLRSRSLMAHKKPQMTQIGTKNTDFFFEPLFPFANSVLLCVFAFPFLALLAFYVPSWRSWRHALAPLASQNPRTPV